MNAGYYVLAVFGGYVVTSVSLLIWPCVHRKKQSKSVYRSHISHRGGAAEGPENTLLAYQRAINVGCEMLELDVHLTEDKKVVVAHDNNLERVTGQDIDIRNTKFEDLPILMNEIPVQFHHEAKYTHEGESATIPLLEDVFKQFPDIPINLDVKEYDEELIAEVNRLVKAFNREHLIVWGNFLDKTCQRLYKENPKVPLLFSMKQVLKLYILFYLGLLPFVPLKETCLEILMPSAGKKAFQKMNYTRMQKILFHIADFLLMSRVMFYHLKKRGILVYLWVCNDEEDFKRAYKLGANGVMTDFPTKLSNWLDEHPQYKTKYEVD